MGIFTDSTVFDLINIFVTLFVIVVGYFKWIYGYWDRNNVPTLPYTISIPFGNAKETFLKRKTFGEQFKIYYDEFRAKGVEYGGIYMGVNKFFVAISPEFIKTILQKDFYHFTSHGVYHDPELEPLTAHLFNLDGAKWKNMRTTLTPTFTSGKMKMMFPTLVNCAIGLKEIMDLSADSKVPVDIKDILGRFTTDIIGSCAFGLECNTLKDPNVDFRKYGRKVFENNGWDRLKIVLTTMLPQNILRAAKLTTMKPGVEKFFMGVVQDTVNYREKNNIYRKDFMHLLIQLKNRGKVTDDEKILAHDDDKGDKAINMNELAAQAFVFYLAGFETSSTTMTFALYEIARHPEIQEKMRTEIREVLKKHNDELTYDAIMEMTYMQKVIEETLRLYPPVSNLPRECTKDYLIPNTSIVIKKGIRVIIPVMGFHRDPEYYPNPELFDPERFSEENKAKRPHFTWLPFGEGPRVCIGLRFGIMQSKVGLVTLLKNYKITLNKKTQVPMKLDKSSFITAAEGGIWLDAEKINTKE